MDMRTFVLMTKARQAVIAAEDALRRAAQPDQYPGESVAQRGQFRGHLCRAKALLEEADRVQADAMGGV